MAIDNHLAIVRRSDLDRRTWIADLPYSTHDDTQAGPLAVVKAYAEEWPRAEGQDLTQWIQIDPDTWILQSTETGDQPQ